MCNKVNILNKELIEAKIELNKIYLDPNNPRFKEFKYVDVPEKQIGNIEVQKNTEKRLLDDFFVGKLVDNMMVNGFLPIDRVIVKEINENEFVVLEGNRRICAAKQIMKDYQKDTVQIDEEIYETVKEINCLIYCGTERQPAWIFQGLRHIIGIQQWPAYNKARLLVQLMENEKLTLTEVGKKFGLSSYGAGQWVRGYYAFMQAANESDYMREIDERAYPYLQEIFSRSNIIFKEWLKWNDVEYRFEDTLRFNEFLSWLYPRDYDGVLDGVDVLGDWNERLIKRSDDIRIVSYLIKESIVDFDSFRDDGDLKKAQNSVNIKKYSENKSMAIDTLENIRLCKKALNNVSFKFVITHKEELMTILKELDLSIKYILDSL